MRFIFILELFLLIGLREANAIKLQSSELAEAERLEREAMMRRERAVGHGKASF